MNDTQNPLIGNIPDDTMSHCQQVLSIIQRATESQETGTSDDEVMGYHLVLNCVRNALEHDHHQERAR